MRESAPANVRDLRGCRSKRPSSDTAEKTAILATAHYLLAPEDTSAGAGPARLPAPLRGVPLAGQIFKTLFWVAAAVGLGLGIALLD